MVFLKKSHAMRRTFGFDIAAPFVLSVSPLCTFYQSKYDDEDIQSLAALLFFFDRVYVILPECMLGSASHLH